jgi:diguanylate cyclase (GGDEF)-like protein
MEIRDRKSVDRPGAIRAPAAAPAAAPATPAEAAATAAAPRDVVDVAGIPEAELTAGVRRAFTALMAEVAQLRRQLDDAYSRISYLEKLADEDPLMPVVNRRAFVRELTRMMAFSQRYGVASSIIYFDVNSMKQVNDTFGHAAGDAVLLAVAKVLLDNVRATDVVGRLGGDEMGVLLVQTDRAVAENKAIELAGIIEAQEVVWEGRAIPVSVAYGVHAFSQGEDVHALIDAADRAMYSAKARQKDMRGP